MNNHNNKLRVVFMGTPAFGLPCLRVLHQHHHVVAVYSQPPQAAARGLQVRPSAVQAWAETAGVPVHTPKSLKKLPAQEIFQALQADLAVVAAYGLLLPPAILNAPRFGCLNLHGSLLPRWRGAAPIQRAIAAGDTETGLCMMQMDAGLDTGAVWRTARVPISESTTASQLHDILAQLGAELILPTLAAITSGIEKPVPQPESGATYAAKITKDEGLLDFNESAPVLVRRVRAFTPWPGTWFISHHESSKNTRIKVLQAELGPSITAPAGTLLNASGLVACGDGTSLQLRHLQREGKGAVPADAFFRGFPVKVGEVL